MSAESVPPKTLRNYWLDLLLLLGFVAAFVSGESRSGWHRGLSVALGVGLALHLAWHRVALVRTPALLLGHSASHARACAAVNLALGIILLLTLASGLIVSPWMTTLPDRPWVIRHHVLPKLALVAVVVHVVQRRTWIVRTTVRMLNLPQRAAAIDADARPRLRADTVRAAYCGREVSMGLRAILTTVVVAALSMACGSGSEQGPSPVVNPPEPSPVLATPSAPLSTIANRNWGWVAPDPGNPRYLRTGGDAGQPFSIASYGTLIGCGFSTDQVRRLKEQGATYVVLWYQWSGCTRETANWFKQPWTGPWRLACDPRDPAQRKQCPDHPLWDLSHFDEDYWRTFDAMLTAAEDDRDGTNRKLIVRVHLFARQEFNIGRNDNPFRGVNNVNGVRSYEVGSDARDPDLRYFAKAPMECETSCGEPIKSLFAYQKAYVRKLLDVTQRHGNVVYEMMNEPPIAANDPTGGAFAYFTAYWSWFVKDYLGTQYGVARLVSQDEHNKAFELSNIDIADARWGIDDINTSETVFLASLNDLAAALRTSYLSNAKVTTLDEFANAVEDPDRLRREAWTIVASGGNFHLEDPCDPEARACDGADSKPWLPVRSIQAFKTASGWRFDRARPAHRDTPGERWFYWMVQNGPPFDTVGFPTAGAQDHVGYLAHHTTRTCRGDALASDLPAVPQGASDYVARLWDPSGTDYLKGDAGTPLEYRFRWGGGVFDWCQTPLEARILGADDVVIHVHAGR